ncbi:MAG: SRPBCC domain-containing protein, partial [Alphaproteobacteria bacterium]|nr:SRPBCC domain-containing protein [Alphaproteobacteria bacterium]
MSIMDRRPKVEIVRAFAQPRERVWRAWTRPEALLRWLGPVDWPAIEVTADVRVGGTWRACLRSTESGEILWQSGRYLEIVPTERLVFSFRWEGDSHEDGPGVETTV